MSEDRLRELTATVARLEETVEALEARMDVLDGGRAAAARVAEVPRATAPAPVVQVPPDEGFQRPAASRLFSLVGYSVLILAGAFLLRALTDSGTLPPLVGFGLGLMYAVVWIAAADRAGGRGDAFGSAGFGLTAVVVAFPFLFETTSVLELVSPVTGGALLAVIGAVGLFSAWRRRFRLLAWAYTMAALLTVLALGLTTGAAEFYAAVLLALGAATMLLAYTRRWYFKRWVVALAADVVIFRLTVLITNPGGSASAGEGLSPTGVIALALALLVVYLGIFTYRALFQGRGVKAFDVTQSVAALLIGFGGAASLARHTGQGSEILGWAAVAAAAAYYTIAFTVVSHRQGRGRGFFYFATLALIFLFLGSREVAEGGWLAWSWIALGLATAILGGIFDRVTLRAHSAVYLVLAGIQTGMFASVRDAFVGSPTSPWRALDVSGFVALVVTAGCYGILVFTQKARVLTRARRLPRLTVGVVCLMGFSSLAVSLLVKILSGAAPEDPATIVSVTRTGVMAGSALVLAGVGRRPNLQELGWTVYPILALGLVKLLLEDLRNGNPLELAIAFALFGAALILAPRMLRKGPAEPAAAPAD
jgi:hypothetical protein